jgi:hypothetical protein
MSTTRPDKATQACTASLSIPATYTDKPLFQVCPGIPAEEALNAASIYLAAAYDLANSSVDLDSDDKDNAVPYLIRMAKSVIDALIAGL